MFLIRGDGNSRIGIGHLMRCMTIAEELALQWGSREEILFVCADTASGDFVRENDFRCHVLGTDYRDMESELPLWEEIWKKLCPDGKNVTQKRKTMLLVDSYYVTDQYLEVLGGMAYTILMDDLGVCRYPVDCVVNYNAPADPEAYGRLYQGSGTRLLIGSRYTPLRRQFRRGAGEVSGFPCDISAADVTWRSKEEAREKEPENQSKRQSEEEPEVQSKRHTEIENTQVPWRRSEPRAVRKERSGKGEATSSVREVMITTGGGDSGNIAGKILERIYRDDITFHIVTGRFSPNFQELREMEKRYAGVRVRYNVKDMAGLMEKCQIALTAGGSTIYELAALGIPFLCFSYAENQEALVDYIGKRQIAGSAGAWHKDAEGTLERIGMLFEELAGHPELRRLYRIREMGMIDGEGVVRLAQAFREMAEEADVYDANAPENGQIGTD